MPEESKRSENAARPLIAKCAAEITVTLPSDGLPDPRQHKYLNPDCAMSGCRYLAVSDCNAELSRRLSEVELTCEAHPGKPWPHDDCPGPGMPWSNCERIIAELRRVNREPPDPREGVMSPAKWAAQFISDLSLHIVNEDYEALEEIKRRSDEVEGIRATLLVNFGEDSKHNRYGIALKNEGTTHSLLIKVLEHLTQAK